MAFNTPFKMWKRYEFNGGTADPCIISWPAGTKARGEIRDQYHHAIDLVPTILDVLGVDAPETIKGHTQTPFDGVSMRDSFDDASAPSTRQTQFYSMLGSRSIWHEGWKAVTTHPTHRRAGATSTTTSGSSTTPTSTAPSCTTWPPPNTRTSSGSWSTSGSPRRAPTARSRSTTARRSRSSTPRDPAHRAADPLRVLPRHGAGPGVAGGQHPQPLVRDRGARRHPAPGAEGVLFAIGSRFGGHALYVKDNRLHYVNSFVGSAEQMIVGPRTSRPATT